MYDHQDRFQTTSQNHSELIRRCTISVIIRFSEAITLDAGGNLSPSSHILALRSGRLSLFRTVTVTFAAGFITKLISTGSPGVKSRFGSRFFWTFSPARGESIGGVRSAMSVDVGFGKTLHVHTDLCRYDVNRVGVYRHPRKAAGSETPRVSSVYVGGRDLRRMKRAPTGRSPNRDSRHRPSIAIGDATVHDPGNSRSNISSVSGRGVS